MKNYSKIIWGVILLAIGAILALNALNITDIDIFFDGWWTLFIIIPCTIGLFRKNDKFGNLIGLLIGIYLLLCCLDIIEFSLVWKLLVPVTVILIGVKMIFGGAFSGKTQKVMDDIKKRGRTLRSEFAAFSGNTVNYSGQTFDGSELTAVFGAIKCDLRNAIITEDTIINFTAVFGGIDILVPEGVNVKVNSTSLFGGVSNKTAFTDKAPTIYVTGLCMFGGVDIK